MSTSGSGAGARGGWSLPRGAEARSLWLICAAHGISHFHILVLPPLFLFLRDAFQVGFIELGLALTVFNVVSGLTQAPIGFLADRFGPRRILVAGLVLGGFAFGSLGFIHSYAWLLVASGLAGLANSVYHPSDYAILSTAISEERTGQAFSFHTFAGFLGSAIAPPVVLFLATTAGLNAALIFSGAIALVVAAAVHWLDPARARERQAAEPASAGAGQKAKAAEPVPLRAVLTPAILNLTLFFLLISLSNGAIQNFSVVALVDGYGTELAWANAALTSFLLLSAFGVLCGGFIADRTRRHGDVAAAGFGMTALLVLLVAVTPMHNLLLVVVLGAAGFLSGIIAPSRDMLVRAAAPAGAHGRVFGIVSTGFNMGGALGPVIFGWLMDRGEPLWVFGGACIFMLLTTTLAFVSDRRAARRQPA